MKFDTEKYPKYPIIADGMMSLSSIGEGRLIPCIMLDKSVANEVDELGKIHETSPPGDSETTWTRAITFSKPKELVLKIKFTSPMELTFGIIFNIHKYANLIDGIFCSQSLHLETGLVGDKILSLKNNGILIEVPKTNFEKPWEEFYFNAIKDNYKRQGVPKSQIKQLVKEHIKSTREIWNIRRT
jgi:hypothetical protein